MKSKKKKENRLVEICRISGHEDPFTFENLIFENRKWRSERICRFPQSFKVHVSIPILSTDLDISFVFEKFFVPSIMEITISEATHSPHYRKSSTFGIQKHRVHPKSCKDSFHSVRFRVPPIINSTTNHKYHIYSIRTNMSKPIINPANVYDQVGIKSILFAPHSEWEEDLPPPPPRRIPTLEEFVKEELESKRFRDLDSYSKDLMKPLLFEKVKLLRSDDFERLNTLQNQFIEPIRKLSREILTLEEEREKYLLEEKEYLIVEWIRSEISEKHEFIRELVRKYSLYSNPKYQEKLKRRKKGKKKKDGEDDEVLYEGGINDRTNRTAALMKYQEDRIFKVLNELQSYMESEEDYFPGLKNLDNQYSERFFSFLKDRGFGDGIEEDEISQSIPPELYFQRLGRLGFGENTKMKSKNIQKLQKKFNSISSRNNNREKYRRIKSEDSVGFEFPGDSDLVLTNRSRRFFGGLRNIGFGEEGEEEGINEPKKEQAVDFFKRIKDLGFGE